jgi:hypothetical protein
MPEQRAEDRSTCDECGKPLVLDSFQNTFIVDAEKGSYRGTVHRDCAGAFITKHGGEPAAGYSARRVDPN